MSLKEIWWDAVNFVDLSLGFIEVEIVWPLTLFYERVVGIKKVRFKHIEKLKEKDAEIEAWEKAVRDRNDRIATLQRKLATSEHARHSMMAKIRWREKHARG